MYSILFDLLCRFFEARHAKKARTQEKARAISPGLYRHELNNYCAVMVTLPVADDFTKFVSPL